MSNHAMPRKGWKRAARGTMLGTAAAGVLLLSGSTPTVAVPLPDRAVAKAADPAGGGYWLTDSDGEVYAFGSASYYGSLTNMHLNSPVVGIASAPTQGRPSHCPACCRQVTLMWHQSGCQPRG